VFLTISTTGAPDRTATDLGFLLHKHPDKAQSFNLSNYGFAQIAGNRVFGQGCGAGNVGELFIQARSNCCRAMEYRSPGARTYIHGEFLP
jgi:hypothetical protein